MGSGSTAKSRKAYFTEDIEVMHERVNGIFASTQPWHDSLAERYPMILTQTGPRRSQTVIPELEPTRESEDARIQKDRDFTANVGASSYRRTVHSIESDMRIRLFEPQQPVFHYRRPNSTAFFDPGLFGPHRQKLSWVNCITTTPSIRIALPGFFRCSC